MSETHAILLASGSGARFGGTTPKQFLPLAGRTLIEHAIAAFDRHAGIDHVHVVVPDAHRERAARLLESAGFRKVRRIVAGGETRRESSAKGLRGVPGGDLVLIHDAARPCIGSGAIDRCLAALERFDAVTVAIAASDTVLRVDADERIDEVPDRSRMRLAQTPQGFRASVIQSAHAAFEADDDPIAATDDCGLVLRYAATDVHVVHGGAENLKITLPEDLERAERWLNTHG